MDKVPQKRVPPITWQDAEAQPPGPAQAGDGNPWALASAPMVSPRSELPLESHGAALPSLPVELKDDISESDMDVLMQQASEPAMVAVDRQQGKPSPGLNAPGLNAHELLRSEPAQNSPPPALSARLNQRWQANLTHQQKQLQRTKMREQAQQNWCAAFGKNAARWIAKPISALLKPFQSENLLVMDFSVIPKADWRTVMLWLAKLPGQRDVTLVFDGLQSGDFHAVVAPALQEIANRIDGATGGRNDGINLTLQCRGATLHANDLSRLSIFLNRGKAVRELDLSGSKLPDLLMTQLLKGLNRTSLTRLNLAATGLGQTFQAQDGAPRQMGLGDRQGSELSSELRSELRSGPVSRPGAGQGNEQNNGWQSRRDTAAIKAIDLVLDAPALEEVDLSENGLDDSVCQTLAAKLQNGISVRRISLDGNYLTDQSLGILVPAVVAAAAHLDGLSLKRNRFSAAAVVLATQAMAQSDPAGGVLAFELSGQPSG